jgi:hypothetical protein
MEFWSKGLGRRSLVLDLGTETVETDAQRVGLAGKVSAPVTWNYILYVESSDWRELFELALRREMATYLLCRRRVRALAGLTAFLFRFVGLYLRALVRVRLGMAVDPAGITVAPDLQARGQIDPAALAAIDDPARSTRRPRPRRSG